MRLCDFASFNRKKFFQQWDHFSHLLIKCRGDGRSYKVMLHAPGYIDLSWANSWSCPLHTHGGPYWQMEQIPFSRFFHTAGGRIQDKQPKFEGFSTSSIGFTLMDRIEGPFQLELAYIGVCHDRSHLEEFAYEKYSCPVFNADTF